MNYQDFIESKRSSKPPEFRDLEYRPSQLFPFQEYLVSWALGQSRSAIFADTGMGKTLQQLTWAVNVNKFTDKPVLILAPLIVTFQTEKESEKFGIDGVSVSRDGTIKSPIIVTNYEQLPKFDWSDFGGVVCDESGILKSFSGEIRTSIIQFMRKVPYRLLCSATPAPNDFVELGNSSEALGIMGYRDMLSKYFTNGRDNTSERRHYGKAPEWQFRGHSEKPFWKWVSQWSRIVRKPSDLGFADDNYCLPSLNINHLKIEAGAPEGMLFALPAVKLDEQKAETKRTIPERVEMVSHCVSGNDSFISWCNLNAESSALKKALGDDAVEISGSDKDDDKIAKVKDFVEGNVRGLITKPKIGAWGLNFQHCHHMTYFPNHSYEQWYQSVRRCWRYGQQNDVTVDVVYTPGEQRILDNMIDKTRKAENMYSQLVANMSTSAKIEYSTQSKTQQREVLPSWL